MGSTHESRESGGMRDSGFGGVERSGQHKGGNVVCGEAS